MRDNTLAVVNGSTHSVMAYTARFDIVDDQIIIHIRNCVYREMENTTIARKVELLNSEDLILSGTSADGTQVFRAVWKKKIKL